LLVFFQFILSMRSIDTFLSLNAHVTYLARAVCIPIRCKFESCFPFPLFFFSTLYSLDLSWQFCLVTCLSLIRLSHKETGARKLETYSNLLLQCGSQLFFYLIWFVVGMTS
jgi:hypothetical protein